MRRGRPATCSTGDLGRTHRRGDGRERDVWLYGYGDAGTEGMHVAGGGVYAAVSAARAAAGATSRAVFWLAASGGQGATDDRRDVAGQADPRHGSRVAVAAVASALPALRALHAGVRRFVAETGPGAARLLTMKISSDTPSSVGGFSRGESASHRYACMARWARRRKKAGPRRHRKRARHQRLRGEVGEKIRATVSGLIVSAPPRPIQTA